MLGLCLLASLGAGLTLSVVGPVVPAMAVRLHAHESDLGIVFGANFLISTLTTPLAGRVVDAVGPRLVLPLGELVMALGVVGEGLAGSLSLLTAAAALTGAGIGINTVCVNFTVSSLYPARREAVLNATNVFFGAGAFLAPLLSSIGLARLGGYTPAFVVIALLLALPALPLLAGLPRTRPATESPASAAASLRSLARERWLWRYGAIGFLYLGAEIGFGGWIVAVFLHATRLNTAAAAPVAALFWLCLALGGIPTGFGLRHGLPPARIIIMGAGVAALSSGALAVFSSVAPVAVVCAALMGLSCAPIFPLNIAAATHAASLRVPGTVGGATALVFLLGQLGGAVIPFSQGLLFRVGPGPTMALTCACCLLIVVIQRVGRST